MSRPAWQFLPGVLSPDACDQVVTIANQIGFQPAQTFVARENYRIADVCFLQGAQSPNLIAQVMMVLRGCAEDFEVDIDSLGYVTICRYTEGCFYDWHHDIAWHTPEDEAFRRKLSLTLELSHPQEYKGGQLEFDEVSAHPPRGIGAAVAFPSYLRHRVTKVESGTRYSLVAWALGPPWR